MDEFIKKIRNAVAVNKILQRTVKLTANLNEDTKLTEIIASLYAVCPEFMMFSIIYQGLDAIMRIC